MGFGEGDVVVCYYGSLDHKWNHVDLYREFFAQCLAQGCKLCILTPAADLLLADDRLAGPAAYIRRVDDPAKARRYISACDYGVIIMKRASDWESRLGVKFVEYLCAGLQVLVGRWVGAAAELARQSFPEHSHVLETEPPRPPQAMRRTGDSERQRIARRAETLFGHARMAELFQD
jgi:hypothetical protein